MKKTTNNKKAVVRQLIVMRKAMVAMRKVSRAPYMRKYTDLIAVDMHKLAQKNGLVLALVTKKF